jgi:hypothetical protein
MKHPKTIYKDYYEIVITYRIPKEVPKEMKELIVDYPKDTLEVQKIFTEASADFSKVFPDSTVVDIQVDEVSVVVEG